MDQYELTVTGFNGALVGRVSLNGNSVGDAFDAKDIKDAEKKARSVALQHQAENAPADYTTHTKFFSV